jgi:alpha-tubulin suppressor-like RCC1 family protein
MRPCTLRGAAFTAALLMASACQQDTEAPSAPEVSNAVTAAAALTFRQVSAGGAHTCAVTTANVAYCWGNGQLTPKPVSGGLKFLEVSAGGSSTVRDAETLTCGVTTGKLVYCWGTNLIPAPVPGDRKFETVSVGLFHICAVNPNDVAFCWGNQEGFRSNQFGQLGTGGGSTATPTRVAGGHKWRRVFAGASQTCGATLDNKGYCWGWNGFGQGGSGLQVIINPKPTLIAGGLSWRQVRPGGGIDNGINSIEIDDGVACGVTQDDKAYCWGLGALGSSTTTQSRTPVAVAGTRRWSTVQPGIAHTCGLTLAGVTFCWGSNERGQLGRTGGLSQTPVRVSGGLVFEGISVAAAGNHTCGVTAAHQVWCWGENGSGQLGDGTHTSSAVPVAVKQ